MGSTVTISLEEFDSMRAELQSNKEEIERLSAAISSAGQAYLRTLIEEGSKMNTYGTMVQNVKNWPTVEESTVHFRGGVACDVFDGNNYKFVILAEKE